MHRKIGPQPHLIPQYTTHFIRPQTSGWPLELLHRQLEPSGLYVDTTNHLFALLIMPSLFQCRFDPFQPHQPAE
jgi:hypothetical protein